MVHYNIRYTKSYVLNDQLNKNNSDMENSDSNIESSLHKIELENKSIKVHDKVAYEPGMNIKKCEFGTDKVN